MDPIAAWHVEEYAARLELMAHDLETWAVTLRALSRGQPEELAIQALAKSLGQLAGECRQASDHDHARIVRLALQAGQVDPLSLV